MAGVEGDRASPSPRSSAEESSPSAPPPIGRDVHGARASAWRARGGRRRRLGARLSTARRARWAATVAVLGAASATLVLLLALASLLVALRDDPSTVGKRYSLTANLSPRAIPDVERIPGVEAAAERISVEGSAAFSLGQPLRLVGLERGPRTSSSRRSPRGGGGAARGRRRSGSGWPTRSACGRGRGSSSRCPAARRAGSG